MSDFKIENNILIKYEGASDSVSLPEGITQIGSYAFKDNKSLRTIEIPDSVKFIGRRAFSGCTALKGVNFGTGLRAMEHSVFSGCTALESVLLPGTLKSVNVATFKSCTSLRELTFEEGVQRICESAFSNCRSLRNVAFPKSMQQLKYFAFGNCKALHSVSFQSEGDCSIDASCFYGTHSELHFHWPESAPYCEELNDGFFVDGSGILKQYFGTAKELLIPSSVQRIGRYAFAGNRTIESIKAPESVVEVENSGMSSVRNLKRIVFDGVKRLGDNSFWADFALESAEFPECLETVGKDCFGHCCALEELDFGNTSASFDGRIAPMAYRLKKFEFPKQLDVIPSDAFYYCERLEDVEIPASVRTIGDHAFVGCRSLTSVTVPGSIATLNLNAFNGCSSLREIILSNRKTVVEGKPDQFFTACVHYADEP